jgi:hypothetical protein
MSRNNKEELPRSVNPNLEQTDDAACVKAVFGKK